MRAVVMAGGEGSRLRPLTIGRPKPMVPIVDKPCIGHIFDLLKRHGITDAFVTLQYMASVIQDAYGDGGSVGMRLRYSVEETPLGTGGSVRQLGKALDAPFLVISGDALTDIDLARVIAFHEEKKAAVTLTLVHVPDPLEYGVVITDGEGRVTKFLEKPSWGEVFSDTINTGIYVIDPRVMERYPVGAAFDFSKDLFPQLLADGEPLRQRGAVQQPAARRQALELAHLGVRPLPHPRHTGQALQCLGDIFAPALGPRARIAREVEARRGGGRPPRRVGERQGRQHGHHHRGQRQAAHADHRAPPGPGSTGGEYVLRRSLTSCLPWWIPSSTSHTDTMGNSLVKPT